MPTHILNDAVALLSHAKRILITTHVRPDGDALGSLTALSLALKSRGLDVTPLLLSRLPNKYSFVTKSVGLEVIVHDESANAPVPLAGYDTLIVVDTGTWSQLPGLKDSFASFTGQSLILDHHLTQESWGTVRIADTAAPAAVEVVADLLDALHIPITKDIASALYVGLVTDTGYFAYNSTRPATHRLAARLLETGIDHNGIYQRIYQSESARRLALQSRIMSSMQLIADNRLSVMTATAADFAATGGDVTDTEGVINWPLQIATVKVSALLTEPTSPTDAVRVSLRSKGDLDCAAFAQQFGGGGHARAAGIKLTQPFDQAVTTLTQSLLKTMAASA
jgi:phosphoesterase RecJ-like protein